MIKPNNQGFSLVEVLVAVAVLLLAVVGPMTIISRTTTSTTFATEQATAFLLAQEGLELVQLARDNRVLDHFEAQYTGGSFSAMNSFETGLSECFGGNLCGLNIQSNSSPDVTITPCTGSNISNCRLKLTTNPAVRTMYIHHSNNVPLTPYTRTVNITRIPSSGVPREYRVTSTVTWRSGNQISDQNVTLVTYLTNTYDLN